MFVCDLSLQKLFLLRLTVHVPLVKILHQHWKIQNFSTKTEARNVITFEVLLIKKMNQSRISSSVFINVLRASDKGEQSLEKVLLMMIPEGTETNHSGHFIFIFPKGINLTVG